jgi:hypothetical protein
MFRSLAILGVILPWLCGCGKPTASTSSGGSTVASCGYTIKFEGQPDGPVNVNGHRSTSRDADGKESLLEEDVSVAYGSHSVKILNGKLTVDGKDHGAVKTGDTIKLSSAGVVSVNDAQR